MGQLSVSEVPGALAPVALPDFVEPNLLITLQPTGVNFSQPVPVTYPNLDNLPPGSEVNIWAVNVATGQFEIVGTGEVNASGSSIVTLTGGITTTTWGFSVPASPNSPTDPDPVDPDDPPCNCPSEPGGSTVGLSDGRMGTRFTLPAYRSLETNRSLSFVYQSSRAHSLMAIPFNMRRGGNVTPSTTSFELSVSGLVQGMETFVQPLQGAATVRSAVAFDGSDFQAGLYAYSLQITNNFTNSSIGQVITGVVPIENAQSSEFGAGWLLSGLYRLNENPDGSRTLVSPEGHMTTYRPSAGDPDVFDPPDSNYATVVRNPDTSFTHIEKDGVQMHFDASGLLTSRVDRNGNTTQYLYDTEGRLETIRDPVGLDTTFVYGADGLLETVTDPASRVTQIEHDAFGNVNRVTYPDTTVERFEYDDPDSHLITAYFDERNNETTYRYDAYNRIIDTTLPDGTVRAVASQTSVGLVNIANGQGTEDNPAPLFIADEANADFVDGRGNSSSETLDEHGAPLMTVDEVGRVTTHVRDEDSNPTQTTRPIGSVVTRTFDNLGNVLTEREEFNTATTTYTYDGFSLVTSLTNPRDHTTTINRDPANGNVLSTVNELGHTTTMEYNSQGLVERMVTPNNLETIYTYNTEGLLETKTENPPVGSPGNQRVWTYTYFDTGLLESATQPDGIVLNYAYDDRSMLTSVTDNLNQSLTYIYDDHKNLVSTETRNADTTLALMVDNEYDTRNRLIRTIAPHDLTSDSITERILDENSNLVGLIDPNGNPSSTTFDAFNRLETNTHRESGITSYVYDAQDRIIEVVAPNGATTQYEYDIISRRTKEISPDRGEMSYAYDIANNVTSITDGRGIAATMTYDELERVATKTYPNTVPGKTEDVTYTYDSCAFGVGRLCARDDESGDYAYAYDAFGNLTDRTFTESSGTVFNSGYVYDDGDNVTQMTLPSGRVVDITRDGVRRVLDIDTTLNGAPQSVVSGTTYRGDNQMVQCTYGNGLTDTRSYDLQGRLVSQTLTDPLSVILDQRDYSYDLNSNILGIDTNLEDNVYTYDKLDRVTSDQIAGQTAIDYGYDLNDNRASKLLGDLTQDEGYFYNQDANQLGAQEAFLAGSTTVPINPDRSLRYNDVGRLYELHEAGVRKAAYLYNDEGQRTRKTVYQPDGVTIASETIYHYDSMGYLVTETELDGTLIRDYLWSEGMHPMAQIDNAAGTEAIIYFTADHRMTSRLATDAAQTIVWRWEGEAFGNTLAEQDPDADLTDTVVNLRFPGQYFDEEANLHYNYHRYYDSSLGRYITSDPIGLGGGLNTYLYANANPITLIDRFGLTSCEDDECLDLYRKCSKKASANFRECLRLFVRQGGPGDIGCRLACELGKRFFGRIRRGSGGAMSCAEACKTMREFGKIREGCVQAYRDSLRECNNIFLECKGSPIRFERRFKK